MQFHVWPQSNQEVPCSDFKSSCVRIKSGLWVCSNSHCSTQAKSCAGWKRGFICTDPSHDVTQSLKHKGRSPSQVPWKPDHLSLLILSSFSHPLYFSRRTLLGVLNVLQHGICGELWSAFIMAQLKWNQAQIPFHIVHALEILYLKKLGHWVKCTVNQQQEEYFANN